MICAEIFKSKENYKGFKIFGHSGYSSQGSDIVCAAVSSVSNMTVNLIYEIFKIESSFKTGNDAELEFEIYRPCEISDKIIEAFILQLEIIFEEYSDFIKVSVTEV